MFYYLNEFEKLSKVSRLKMVSSSKVKVEAFGLDKLYSLQITFLNCAF